MKTKSAILVILTPGFPENEADSTCLPAQQHIVRAVNRLYPGIKILILSFQYPFVQNSYQWHGNTVIAFGGKNRGQLSRFIIWKRVWQQLKTIHKENNIMGLLSFWCGECAFVAHRYAKKTNAYVKRVGAGGEHYIALSDFIKDSFYHHHGIRPAHVIPIGIDTAAFGGELQNKTIDIAAAGSLIPLKQYEIFIRVVAALKNNLPGIKAVLCGKGPELHKLQTLINDLLLQHNITLCGERPYHEVLEIMQQAKLFLHPSSYEGFGMVCSEALYAGAQVISFCRPMHAAIPNWHIVENKEEMIEKATALLQQLPRPQRILVGAVDATATALVQLFGYRG